MGQYDLNGIFKPRQVAELNTPMVRGATQEEIGRTALFLLSDSFHQPGNKNRRIPMIDKNELCHKIREIYPDLGKCGIDVDVAFDETNQRWVVDLKKGSRRMKTFLEEGDAESCLQGRQLCQPGH